MMAFLMVALMMARNLILSLFGLSLGLGLLSCLAPSQQMGVGKPQVSLPNPSSSIGPDRLKQLAQGFDLLCWITYTPSTFNPTTTPMTWPTASEVQQDLQVLHRADFRGLVTYRAFFQDRAQPDQRIDLGAIAQDLGFAGLIVGVWDPESEPELRAAEQLGQQEIVLGYSVGNEGLGKRYDLATLEQAMDRLRGHTQKPVSTTEEQGDYLQSLALHRISDWLFPNVHPYFAGLRDPQQAVDWTVGLYEALRLFSPGILELGDESRDDSLNTRVGTAPSQKLVVFKEVGLPTAGDDGVSELRQSQYYQALGQTSVKYVVFAGFDLAWKQPIQPRSDGANPEPHWGVFYGDRRPKLAATHACSS
jgi:exo-beta-1,3-glucanase (GH17 family)